MFNLSDLVTASFSGAYAALQYYRTGNASAVIESKSGGEFAMLADLKASEAIAAVWQGSIGLSCVDEERPDTHALLDLRDGRMFGVVDPLDGSGIFQTDSTADPRVPPAGWGSALGVMQDGRVLAGVMQQPALKQLFAASATTGCLWAGGELYDRWPSAPDRVSYIASLSELRVPRTEVDRHNPLVLAVPASSKMTKDAFERYIAARRRLHELQLLGNERSSGCAVANVAEVMFGKVAAYINIGGGKAWDLAVPFELATKAGCHCSLISGAPIVWSSEPVAVLCARDEATAERLYPALRGL